MNNMIMKGCIGGALVAVQFPPSAYEYSYGGQYGRLWETKHGSLGGVGSQQPHQHCPSYGTRVPLGSVHQISIADENIVWIKKLYEG